MARLLTVVCGMKISWQEHDMLILIDGIWDSLKLMPGCRMRNGTSHITDITKVHGELRLPPTRGDWHKYSEWRRMSGQSQKKGVGWGIKLNICWTIYFGMLSQQFANTHLFSWVERAITVRVKCLAQEHDTVTPIIACVTAATPQKWRAALTKAALTRT